jgi:hypothetical protein
VPDDVTLLWAEGNWGNVRRLPTPEERKRPGGAGVYYHFDYHGGPRSYQFEASLIGRTKVPAFYPLRIGAMQAEGLLDKETA